MDVITLYESKFQVLTLNTSQDIIYEHWFSETYTMDDNEYQQEFLNLVEAIKDRYYANYWLIDLRNFDFIVDPELQEWHKDQVFQKLFNTRKVYFALLQNSSFVNDLAVKQTFDEAEDLALMTRDFKDKEEARDWLIKQQ